MEFKNTYGHRYSLEKVVDTLYKSVLNSPTEEQKLIVGSDSQRFGNRTVYITVIVLHHVGKGGQVYYMKNILPHRNYIDLSVRISQETAYTVEVLQAIENSPLVDAVGKENLSAHVDAGYTGGSKKVVDACIGWIRGLGFECQSKPEAFVASHVADKFTK